MRKIRVLEISTVGIGVEGITSVIKEYTRVIDKKKFQMYILVTDNSNPTVVSEFRSIECEVCYFPSRKEKTIKYFWKLVAFIKKNKVDVVHVHGNSATITIELLAALIGGAKGRIAHSHNTKCEAVVADSILRPFFNKLYTDAIACSEGAGEWLFKRKDFIILKNARNIDEFVYSSIYRGETRKKLSIGDKIAIGHVGGFVEQKNHRFILEICECIKKQKLNYKIFCAGEGCLMDKIIEESKKLQLQDYIEFVGNIDWMSEFICAMDVMILPSLFEGLPLVTIEWQISGIPCLISDKITK